MADGSDLFSLQLDAEVLAKAREEVARSHDDLNRRALDGITVPESVRPGCDVTLSHMALTRLPSELIDVVKNDVARLALDNNRLPSLSGLAPRFHECSRLRYLVMRNNQMREFPQAILNVSTLELLDLKGNKIMSLPEDLSRLRNLRVFSIYHNRITNIPLCVANMPGLVHFAARKNPIQFPNPEEWIVNEPDADSRDKLREDQRISAETKNLKAALAAYSRRERLKVEADSELSEENVETPRPVRRRIGGRFPIKPTSSATDLTSGSLLVSPPIMSHALPNPPAMSLRSMARLPTEPQTATFRPTVVPLMGLSERNRSSSESQMSSGPRAKRFGRMGQKPMAQIGLDTDPNERLSHLRGLSHGSALQNGSAHEAKIETGSPSSPNDGDRNGSTIRRLSSLPEGKRKSQAYDPVVDLAGGIAYALDQISFPIRNVILAVRDGRRTHLERSLQNGLSYVADLHQNLSKAGLQDEDVDEAEKNERKAALRLACLNCLRAFERILRNMQHEIRTLIVHNSPPRVRTLMHMLHASLIEIRNACSTLGVRFQKTSKPYQRDEPNNRYLTPDLKRPSTSMRVRDLTSLMGSRTASRSNSRVRHMPSSSVPAPPPFSALSRNGSMTSLNGVIRANESFPPYPTGPPQAVVTRMSRSNTLLSVDESDEEAQFENIYTKLLSACDFAGHALPACQGMIVESRRSAQERGVTEADRANYPVIAERCTAALESSEALKRRLLKMRLKEPEVRTNLEFWQLCTSFTRAYALFAARVKDCYTSPVSLLPDGVKHELKPLQRSVKEVSKAINDSIWGSLAATPGQQSALVASRSMTNVAALNQANLDAAGVPHQSLRGRPAHSRTNTLVQQQRQPLQLSLATRGNIPPPNPLDPSSAASTHSVCAEAFPLGLGLNGLGLATSSGYATPILGTSKTMIPSTMIPSDSAMPPPRPAGATSGYVTPLPATPLSAALGPAASATVPLPVSLALSNLAAGATTNLTGPVTLGGLLSTSSTVKGVNTGQITAIPPPTNGARLLPNPPVAVPGLVGASNTDKQGMVSGLQGYLSAAGAVPLSGIPVPPMPPIPGSYLAAASAIGQAQTGIATAAGVGGMQGLQQTLPPHAIGNGGNALSLSHPHPPPPPHPPLPMMSQALQGYRPVTPTAGFYERAGVGERPRSLSQRR